MRRKKKRAERGAGSLVEKRPGYYELRFYVTDADGKVKRKAVGGRDINSIYDRAEEMVRISEQRRKGVQVDSTIPEILSYRILMKYDAKATSESGYQRNVESLKVIEKSALAKKPIHEITETDIVNFLAGLDGYSASVIGKTYGLLKQAYNEAVRRKILEENLIERLCIVCPKPEEPPKKVMAFTIAEQERFIMALDEYKVPNGRNNYKLQLKIELHSGARMGEINALRPCDIDLENNLLHIRGTVARGIGGRYYRKQMPKTSSGYRSIPINKHLRPALEQALAEMKDNVEGTIFYDYNTDKLIATSQVNNFYNRLCEKYKIRDFGQHSLRHTFATRCIESGIQPGVLKNWLGHHDIRVTINTYFDAFARLNDDSISIYERYLGEELGKDNKAMGDTSGDTISPNPLKN